MPESAETLYTTAEIMLATGIGRGTITNRAKRLRFKRNGVGYTVDQIIAILTVPLQIHRKCEETAMQLRETLNERFAAENIPMAVVSNREGEWMLEYRKK